MKKHLLITGTLLISSLLGYSQISKGGLPATFTAKLEGSQIISSDYQTVELIKPDLSVIESEDNENASKDKPYRIGVNTQVSLSIENSGTWEVLENGDKVWRLAIKMANAKALGLYFSEPVKIPFGGKLHAYNNNHSQYVGAYTSETPSFQSMEMIQGEVLNLEYYMSSKSTQLPTIKISEVVYYYRGVEGHINGFVEGRPLDDNRAQSCQVDVACSETTGWEGQRDATVHYSFSTGGGTAVCSASVINNTNNDCKPYILTANHCGEPDANSDINNHTWYFNYQRPTCANVTNQYTGARSQTMSGGSLKSSSSLGNQPAGGPNNVDGSDFALIELNSDIPSGYNAYYAGWSIATAAATSGVGIHHPAGHEKKISTFTNSLASDTYNNGGWANAHWEVQWSSTTNGHGVTEGGSSGSPIFNQNGLIVGFLSGGSSQCNATSSTDLYGKMDRAWDQEGTNSNQRLKPWLDPTGSGATTLTGTYAPCDGTTGGGGGTGSGPCAATSTDCDNHISNVKLNTIDKTSVCENYADFTSTSTILTIGESYDITVTANTYYTDDEYAIWIDWNNDGDFEDSGERVGYTKVDDNFSNVYNFTVPSSATLNEDLVMRVRTSYEPSDGAIDPCGTSQYGEVEDYTVKVEEAGTNAIENNDLSRISIYPNPTNNIVYVNMTNILNLKSITLRDITGRVITQNSNPNGTVQFDLSNEAKGVYFINIESENGSTTKKVVKY
jgi:hypothetical protein